MTSKLIQLCRQLNLGQMTREPQNVSGGFLHRMFRLDTTSGTYAVKALNPDVMTRPEALRNMQTGERVNAEFGMRNAEFRVCAPVGGVTEVEGRYFIVYPWVEGASVYPPEITAEHCRVMGSALGCIHGADIRVEGLQPDATVRQLFDWSLTADAAPARWDAQVLAAQRKLLGVQVISHRDLDPKNVMWQGMTPCIIDWEAAGYVNPWQELVELLNYWADDEPKARAMIGAYASHMDIAAADWDAAIAASMDGMLGWLHYNLRRAQGLEGTSPEDRVEGIRQAESTLAELHRYAQRQEQLKSWLKM